MRLASCDSELSTHHVRCIDHSAGGWIVLFEVDGVDREFLIPLEELNEAFDLLLRVADHDRASFDHIGLRGCTEHQERERQGEACDETEGSGCHGRRPCNAFPQLRWTVTYALPKSLSIWQNRDVSSQNMEE